MLVAEAAQYVLSREEVRANGFGMNGCGTSGTPVWHPMVGMDCEMCHTRNGLELTRVMIVAARGGVLMDELVRPATEITEYNTRYGGITAATLDGVTTSLTEA